MFGSRTMDVSAALADPTRAPGQKLETVLARALEVEGEGRVLSARPLSNATAMHALLRPFDGLFSRDALSLLEDAARIDGWTSAMQGAFAHQARSLRLRLAIAESLTRHGPLPAFGGGLFAGQGASPLPQLDARAQAYVTACREGVQEASEWGAKWQTFLAHRPDAPPDAETVLQPAAQEVLRRTEGPVLALMHRVLADAQHERDPGQPVAKQRPSAAALVQALGQGGQAPRVVARGRLRRLSEALKGVQIREMGEFARVERENPTGVSPIPAVWAVRVPHRVVLWPQSPAEGALGEICDLYALGRAMALCLVTPAEPVATRHRPDASTVGTLGGTLSFLGTTRLFVERTYGRGEGAATDAQIAAVHRHALLAHLLAVRLAATRYLVARMPERARRDGAVDAVRDALCGVALPVGLSAILADVAGHDVHGDGASALRGVLGGFQFAFALRDRFDEDWFLNPRAEEAVRAFCYRGAGRSAEALLEELGATVDDGLGLLTESTAHL